jgi:CelD/BcsL family acetyltransferase involved in cellulose biosynthesis
MDVVGLSCGGRAALAGAADPAPWRVEVMAPLSPDCPPVLMRPDAEDGAWAAVAQWLRRRGGVRALVAGRVDEARASACGRGAGVAVIARPCTPRMVVPVPAEWDAYLAALGSNTRSGIRKMARQFIEETPDAAFEVLTDVQACAPMLDRLIELHRRRWRHTPAGSVFESAAMARFYHDLIAWASGQGLASIACLRCGAQVLAAHVMFHAPGDDTLYSHLIGRDPDANHPKCHGPGNLINALTVRWAMTRGYRQYDLSFGNVSQKEQIGAAPMPLFELELARTAGEAALLHGTHSAWGHMRQWPRAVRCAWRRDGRA